MKSWFVLPAFLLCLLSPVFAADTPAPTTANKVEGPVTGKLPDSINVQIQNPNRFLHVLNLDTVSVSFCTPGLITCSTPNRALHIAGQRQLTGIHMTPDAEGEWRWDSDYDLVFTPKKPWPVAQPYRVQFDAAVFPAPVKWFGGSYDFASDSLKPTIDSMEFFQDPIEVEKRGVSTTINFNTAVDAKDLKDHLQFTLQELTDAAKPGDRKVVGKEENMPFDLQLVDDGTTANVTVPLKTLPDKERFLKAVVSPGLMAKAGGKPLDKVVDQRVRVPSRYDYASIDDIRLNIIKNDHFVPEQVLIVESNVPFTNAELAKHLKIYQLPKDKAVGDDKTQKDYQWTSANEVTDDILARAPPVKFSINDANDDDDATTLHSLKLDTDVGRWLYVRVGKGMVSKGDYVLSQDHNDTVNVPAYTKEVKILSDGALLSLSGEKKISVYSLGAQKLHVEIQRVINDDINNLVSQTNGSFEKPNFGDEYRRRGYDEAPQQGSFAADNLSERFSEDIPLPSDDARKPQFSAFDFTPYLTKNPQDKSWVFGSDPKGKGLFFLTVKAMAKDDKGKDQVVSSDRRFVLVSDLGLAVKTGSNGSHDVFVQSVKSGDAVGDAVIDILGVNGLPVLSVNTDGQGHAVIPNLKGFENDKKPVAYVVRKGDDLAFMSIDSRDRRLNYSKFDTYGADSSADAMRAYMFSDRGIYRPGEEGHIGIVVKQGDWSKSLADVPLQLEVTNPRGQVVDKQTVKMNAAGFVDYTFSTRDTSPTGEYSISLYVVADGNKGDELGNTSVRVEEFLPDTLKIQSSFNKSAPKGWIKPEGLKAIVTMQHLYGAPAVDHRIKADISVEPSGFSFKDYPDYHFFDSLKEGKSFDQPAGEAKTDAEGKATFNLDLTPYGNSTYRLTFGAEGFAQDSGRSVHAFSSVLVSSLPYVVGMKSNGNLGYINKNEKRSVSLIALDPDLNPVAVQDVKLKIAQINYVQSLIKNEQGAYEYRSVPKETVIATGDYNIPAAGASYALDTAKPGSYAAILSDKNGMVLYRIAYTVVGEGNMLGHSRKDAEMDVRLDKPKYNPGDTISLNIVAPYTGTGLITLETDKVLAFKWFKTTATSSVQSIAIPKDFVGRGFVNVQFVRSLESKEVYTKPLAYHVEPFYVSMDSVNSKIDLKVPEKTKPGDTITVKYKTATPGKIVVYAVDEGILQYAHYKAPDPLDFYLNSRALQVETTQILDLLMPEYSILQALSATGGGDGGELNKNLNPFKRKTQPPVVYWSGVIDADATPRELHYTVPDYFNGTLHFMAVAVSDRAMGAADAKSFVQGAIILSPNVPTFAAPGDEFTVGLSVANNIQGSGKDAHIKLTVTPSEQLDVIDGKESDVVVAEGGEAKAQVHVRAKDVLGGATLTFAASSGGKSVKLDETLSVRPPLPSMTALLSGYSDKDSAEVQQARDIYKEFGSADASVSTLPVSLIPGLSDYLVRFPYGCTEQTISQAFPAVILYGQKDLGGDKKVVEESVRHTMSRLSELQTSKGGFTYWWYGGEPHDFVTVYALHYMVLAREKHLPVPDGVFRNAQDYVREMVNQSPHSLDDARVQAYGIYVLTRSGVVTGNYLPNLLEYLQSGYKDEWKNDLTAVYIAAAYKLMKLTPEADKLMNEFALGDPVYWQAKAWHWDNAFYNSLDRYAQYMTIVADHFPDMLPKLDRNILFRIANFIGEGDYNTLSSSYAIMAFSAYGQTSMGQAGANLAISQDGKQLRLTGEQVKRAQLALAKGPVKFSGGGNYGLFYQLATDGYDREKPTQPIEDGLEIKHDYLGADHKPVKDVKIGDVVDVVVTMHAHDNKTLENMAMVDLLPSGFETVPESIAKPSVAANDNASNDDNNQGGDSQGGDAPDAKPSANFGEEWPAEAIDAREDRIIAFGDIPPEDVVFHYKIKAVNAGTFTTPPAYVESMYERTVKARGVIGSIAVK